jgi:hypothetical protein
MSSFTSSPQEKVDKARKMIKSADKMMKTSMLKWSVDPLQAAPLYEKAGANEKKGTEKPCHGGAGNARNGDGGWARGRRWSSD